MVKDECYDVELYDWTKVDITQEDQKALVNAYFEEPDEIQGMKLLETKCFKWWASLWNHSVLLMRIIYNCNLELAQGRGVSLPGHGSHSIFSVIGPFG